MEEISKKLSANSDKGKREFKNFQEILKKNWE